MAGADRLGGVFRVLRGVLIASAATMLGMAGLAALVIYAGISDEALTITNQVLKILSILLGVYVAVGAGGERGLITGALVAMLYILVGYGFYCLIDGAQADARLIAVETAAAALVGGIGGALIANMRPRRRRAH